MKTIPTRAEDVIRGVCTEHGVVLLELVVRGSEQRPVIEVYIDSPEGITLERCQEVHTVLGDTIDSEGFFPLTYRLDVSSPGVERPLQHIWQFKRNTGRLVELHLTDGTTIKGRIAGVAESVLELQPEPQLQRQKRHTALSNDGQPILCYPFENIQSGLLQMEW